jgi:ribonuclease HI
MTTGMVKGHDVSKSEVLVVSTDGSALRNPSGPAGWCWFVDEGCWASGGWRKNTNNVAELTAVLELLRAVPRTLPLCVQTDSQYVISCLTQWVHGWKKRGWRTAKGEPVKNAELIASIDAELRGRSVVFEWIKGHAGHPRQEAADVRARAVSAAFDTNRPVPTGPGWTR